MDQITLFYVITKGQKTLRQAIYSSSCVLVVSMEQEFERDAIPYCASIYFTATRDDLLSTWWERKLRFVDRKVIGA